MLMGDPEVPLPAVLFISGFVVHYSLYSGGQRALAIYVPATRDLGDLLGRKFHTHRGRQTRPPQMTHESLS